MQDAQVFSFGAVRVAWHRHIRSEAIQGKFDRTTVYALQPVSPGGFIDDQNSDIADRLRLLAEQQVVRDDPDIRNVPLCLLVAACSVEDALTFLTAAHCSVNIEAQKLCV